MKKFRFTIRKKTMALIIVFAFILISVSMIFSVRILSDNNEKHYRTIATNLSRTLANTVDTELFVSVKTQVQSILDTAENKVLSDRWGSEEWLRYCSLYDSVQESADFLTLRESMREVQDVNDVSCVYLGYVDTEYELVVYVVDAAYEDACPPGCLDIVYDVNRDVLKNPEHGFPVYVTDTDEYGWLVTSGSPIYDNDGAVVGYAFVDVSMSAVQDNLKQQMFLLFTNQIIALILICVVGILYVNLWLIRPLKKLTDAASGYMESAKSGKASSIFSDLKIKVNDEIGDLAESMKKMEHDINSYLAEIRRVSSSLETSQKIAGEMEELANTDSLTGVSSSTSYDRHVSELDAAIASGKSPRFGIVMIDLNNLKTVNDTYGHHMGDKTIVNLSRFVCGIYRNSSVYRYGGDEFVVVLEGEDIDRADALAEQFYTYMKNLKPDEITPDEYISAAMGYSMYDSGKDTCVLDVFKRADVAMYAEKSRMKGET